MVVIKELKIKLGPRSGGKMTNDASLVAMIDSVERLAVSVADQSETGCGSVRYWCQSLQLGPIHSSASFPGIFICR